jgi:hypothetical protein
MMDEKEKIYKETDLVYAAYNRCPCGAGLAYPVNIGMRGYWDCSAILTGKADAKVQHTAQLPFMFYEIKSEQQPSAGGATTRPQGEIVDRRISLGKIQINFGVIQLRYLKGKFLSTFKFKYL